MFFIGNNDDNDKEKFFKTKYKEILAKEEVNNKKEAVLNLIEYEDAKIKAYSFIISLIKFILFIISIIIILYSIYTDKPNHQKLLNIYICTHKDFPNKIKNKIYYKILCDRRNQLTRSYSLEIIPTDKDNELYPKSHGYGECSKIYYIWKQYKSGNISSKYVGFNHYSKIFKFKNKVPNMEDIFNKYDAVLRTEYDFGNITLREHFDKSHFKEFLDETLEIIKLNFTEYYQTAISTMKRTRVCFNNIFIMKKEHFLKYGEFIFGVLLEFDRRHNLKTDEDIKKLNIQEVQKTNRTNVDIDFQSRLQGFLAERISQIFYDYHFHNTMKMDITGLN